jgi:hypothetical protein
MKIKRVIVFTTGLTIGYLAGTSAGRERYDRIKSGAAAVAADLGLARVSQHLRDRSGEIVRASVDRAAETACDGIDVTADKLEALLALPDPYVHKASDSRRDSTPADLAVANGSRHTKHKGK